MFFLDYLWIYNEVEKKIAEKRNIVKKFQPFSFHSSFYFMTEFVVIKFLIFGPRAIISWFFYKSFVVDDETDAGILSFLKEFWQYIVKRYAYLSPWQIGQKMHMFRWRPSFE